jgi:hypothetical protein
MSLFDSIKDIGKRNHEDDSKPSVLLTTNVNKIGLSNTDSVKSIQYEASYNGKRSGNWAITQDHGAIKISSIEDIERFTIVINIICKFGMMNLLSTSHLHTYVFDKHAFEKLLDSKTINISFVSKWCVGKSNTTTTYVNNTKNEIKGGDPSMQVVNTIVVS